MKCDEVKKSLGALHDGAASGRVKNQLENHLSGCLSCRAALDRLRALSVLLQKDAAPPLMSPSLDQKLMQTFRAKHERPAKPAAWWKTIFAGSVSVPKPVFAAVLIAAALAIAWANLSGRNETMTADTNNISTAPIVPPPFETTQTTETIKVVKVPVIKERLVTKTVFVERAPPLAETKRRMNDFCVAESGDSGGKIKAKTRFSANKQPDSDLALNGSVAANGFFTSGNLAGFQPAAELKTRIIEEKNNKEK